MIKVRISTALRLGCLTGLLTSCGPACLCSLAANRLIHAVRGWVLSWDGPEAELSIGDFLGGTTLKLSLDLQEHLNVTSLLKTLKTLESGWWWTIPLLTLVLTLLGGLLLATLTGTGASLYNWIGRRQLTRLPTAWLSLAADPTRRWPLHQARTRIGSDPTSEVPLPGGATQHAEIRREQGRYVLYDLSDGRTWVQGHQVTGRHVIQDGFHLRLGDVEMIFGNE
jgi:hypothetical protein